MMPKPLIGITAGIIINKQHPWSPVVLGESHTYIDSIVQAGGIPIAIPVIEDLSVVKNIYDMCDGILMTGGNDVDPSWYKAEKSPLTVDTSMKRDSQELKILTWADADNKPLFAICRGMQLLNVHRGGTLYQDLETERPDSTNHHLSTDSKSIIHIAHKLQIEPSSKLANIVGTEPLPTNTHHHQGIRKLGANLNVNALAEDGVIEGFEATDKTFVIGVQSHPESLGTVEPRWQSLFKSLVTAAKAKS